MAPYDVKGKHVIITGASSGIGRELAKCFAAAGARLFLGCLPAEKKALADLAAALESLHGVVADVFPVDLSEENGPEAFYRAVKKTSFRVDVLVNNAGVMAYGNFHELPPERMDTVVRVNVLAYMKLMRLALPDIIAAKGRVLNVSSVSAFQPTIFQAVYGASKSFIQSLSEAVAEELREREVKICTLNPPYTETPLLHGDGFPERLWWHRIAGVATAEEVAKKGFRAFIRGKEVYIPGLRHHILHRVINRLLPGKMVNRISRWVCRASS